ncbi:arylesterase [Roseovarius sp. Pro17]|uniref:arylesterase n=1 Tax=Roseovarius sp. Pro17 TaxID=3108175 RepID=UPI002D771B7A|nr:arylesterase [Roseovarius sp. Pro17]
MRNLLEYGVLRTRGKTIALALALSLGGAAFAAEDAMPGEVRIMTFGDSLTAGYGLKRENGFVAQLSVWLRENGTPDGVPVRLLNSSVSGSTTAGGVRRIDWALGDTPDAMIVELGGNDLLRGVDPAETRANLDAILAKAAENDIEVLLVGLIAKDNYGPDYRAAFNAIYPDLAEKYGTLLELDFFGALPEANADQLPYLQADGTHPNTQGIALVVAGIGPKVQELIAESLADRD